MRLDRIGLFIVILPLLSSAKAPEEICPRTIELYKAPLPQSQAAFVQLLSGLMADMRKNRISDGVRQEELFCADMREKLWNRLVEALPPQSQQSKPLQVLLGDYAFEKAQWDKARDHYYSAHQLDVKDPYVALRLAKIAEMKFQKDVQREYLKVALAAPSKDPAVAELQKDGYFELTNMLPRSEAEAFISKEWARAFPNDYRRALALLKIGESARDEKLMARGVDLLGKLAPNTQAGSLVFFFRGERYYFLKDFNRAQADLQSFLSQPDRDKSRDLDAFRMLIEAAQENRDKRAVAKWTEEGLALGLLKEDRFLRIHEESIRFEDFVGVAGLSALKTALSYHKKSLPIASVLARRALALVESGDIELMRAASPVDNLEMDFPDSPESAFLRAKFLRLQKKFSNAQVYFNSARTRLQSGKAFLDPTLQSEFLIMGAENLLSNGKPKEAQEWVEWAKKLAGLSNEEKDRLETLKNRSVRERSDF